MAATNYAKTVKKTLIDIDKSQEWLMAQVTERTGLFLDSGYLGKIFRGERNAPKIVNAINEILQLNATS